MRIAGAAIPCFGEMASLSLTANLELNRYLYPTSPARIGNWVVYHSLSKLQDFSEMPGIVPPEVIAASTLLNGLISPTACL